MAASGRYRTFSVAFPRSFRTLAAGHGSRRQRLDVAADLARPREPYPGARLGDVLDHAPELAQPVRLAEDEAVQHHAHDERPAFRFLEHLLELVEQVLAVELRR